MTDAKITELEAKTTPLEVDLLAIVDTGIMPAATKKMTRANFMQVEDTPADGHTTNPISSNWAYDHAAADVVKSDFNANTILAATSDDTPAALEVTEQTVVGRITSGNIAALSVAQLQTLALSAALPENVVILLDAALSADEKHSGIAETGIAGATLAYGQVCYLAAGDQRWELAKADAAATCSGKLGICIQAAASDGDPTTMLLWGKVREDTAYAWTINAPVFVSAATAGAMTNTAPTGTTNFVVRIVGYGGITADELMFMPDNTYLELA